MVPARSETPLQWRLYGPDEVSPMAVYFSQWSSDIGKIDRHYLVTGWWGTALAVFGAAVLFLAMTFLPLD